MEEKLKKFKAKNDYLGEHNGRILRIEKGKTYDKVSKFWEATLVTEKVIGKE